MLANRIEAAIDVAMDATSVRPMQPSDHSDHGLATASLICGGSVDGFDLGVAPLETQIASARVLEGGETLARILVALEWIVDLGASVVCMPFAVRGPTRVFDVALREVRSRGVSIVAAAGNRGARRLGSPADGPHVLAVGACDREGNVHPTSGSRSNRLGFCIGPHVLAHGVERRVAGPAGATLATGTSFAAAHVAGVVAMLRSQAPGATPDDIDDALIRSAAPVDSTVQHRSRAGMIDAQAALEHLVSGRPTSRIVIGGRAAGAKNGRFVDPFLSALLVDSPRAQRHSAIVCLPEEQRHDVLDAAGIDDVRHLSRLSTTIVRGSADAIERLVREPTVSMISATRVDRRPRTTSADRMSS